MFHSTLTLSHTHTPKPIPTHRKQHADAAQAGGGWRGLARVLTLDAALWAGMWAMQRVLGQPVSRRAANLPYCLWILALNLLLLAATRAAQLTLRVLPPQAAATPTWQEACNGDADAGGNSCMEGRLVAGCRAAAAAGATASDKAMSRRRPSLSSPQPLAGVLQALSYNMLPAFLLANLLTGAVNLLSDTLSVGDTAARVIVSAYALVVATPAFAAHARGVRLRLS